MKRLRKAPSGATEPARARSTHPDEGPAPQVADAPAPTRAGRPAVSARSGRTFSLLFQSNSLREILARLLAAAWMAMAEDERASGVAMA